MAWLQTQDSFNPDTLDNSVLGIATELAQHDSGVTLAQHGAVAVLPARTGGASEKTISRIFRRETGLSYQQWRQQWRLIKAGRGAEPIRGRRPVGVLQRQRLRHLFQEYGGLPAQGIYGKIASSMRFFPMLNIDSFESNRKITPL